MSRIKLNSKSVMVRLTSSLGNIFRYQDLDAALADTYTLQEDIITSAHTPKFISLNASFGSSDQGCLAYKCRYLLD